MAARIQDYEVPTRPFGGPVERPQIPRSLLAGIRCFACGGNVYGDEDALTCMMCGRTVRVQVQQGPRLREVPPPPRTSRRVGDGEEQRIARSIGKSLGETAAKARLLRRIPDAPLHITAWELGRRERTSTTEVRSLLVELIELGLVVEVAYQAGCVRTREPQRGYQRPPLEVR